jgi:hypothetical protein
MDEEQKKRLQENLQLLGNSIGTNQQDFPGQAVATSMLGTQQVAPSVPTTSPDTPQPSEVIQPQESRLESILSSIGAGLKSGFSQPPAGTTSVPVDVPGQRFAGEAIGEYITSPERPSMMEAASMVTPTVVEPAASTIQGVLNIPAAPDMGTVAPTGAAPSVMGVEETRARLLREFGAPTISQIQETPTLGLRTDPQGRMIPAGFTSRAEAFPEYEADAAEMQARIAARPDFTESVSDSERRAGQLSEADLRDLAQAQTKGATQEQVQRGLEIQQRAGLGEFKPEQTKLQEEMTRKRLEALDVQIANAKQAEPDRVEKATNEADRLIQAGLLDEKSKQAYILGQLGGDVDALLGSGIPSNSDATPTNAEEDSGFKIVQ